MTEETYRFGVVILTQGRRPAELQRGFESLQRQKNVALDVVVVGNGWEPSGVPEGFKTLHLSENVGIPAGRNAGVPLVDGEFLFFLDDDSWLLKRRFLANCARRFRADASLGMIQPRIVDPARRGEEPTNWLPRMRKTDPDFSSTVFSVAETAVALPRAVFEATGGWPGTFFYAHEGIELAWRVWDTGHRVVYLGDLEVGHPVVDDRRHDEYYFMNARNRVWLARRCLPFPISLVYVINWTGVQLIRWRHRREGLRTWGRGWLAGWTTNPWAPGERRPKLAWRTIGRMARAGRIPVV